MEKTNIKNTPHYHFYMKHSGEHLAPPPLFPEILSPNFLQFHQIEDKPKVWVGSLLI